MSVPTTPELPKPDLWLDASGLRGYKKDLGPGPWYSAESMRAALAAPASPWLPIESAPKDGTESLFYTKESGRVVLYWNDWPEWPAESEVVEERWSNGFSDQRFDPTHWMPMAPRPLPAAPLAGPVEQGEQG